MWDILITLLFLSCSVKAEVTTPSAYSLDESSFANPDQIKVTHVHLDLEIDFTNSLLKGVSMLTLEAVADNVQQVNLDYQGIDITGIIDSDHNDLMAASQMFLNLNPALGSALAVMLVEPLSKGDIASINVTYQTNAEQSAASWMTPSQTAGQTLNYVFTQCEAAHCRSVAPLQDTPSLKAPYSARIKAPTEYQVYMSAVRTLVEEDPDNPAWKNFYFEQTIPIPSYLIALVAGDLAEQSLGSRTSVITEPSMLASCASELSDLELSLDTAEAYLTEYIWGTYTVLVLPPSFPYGGMENPLLTFASPTIIVGDKSQVYVATHEICHSWTGNEVTCENWSNMWLNEGFTVFCERAVSSELNSMDFAKTEAILGNYDMLNDMNSYGLTNSYSSLYPVMNGANPDDSFSTIPYEKGFQFLVYLQSLVGEDDFQQFLQQYITAHSLTSIDYTVLQQDWNDFVTDTQTDPQSIIDEVDWDTWVLTPGLPPITADFSNPDQALADSLALEYLSLGGYSSPSDYSSYFDFYANQKVLFLSKLIEMEDEVSLLLLQRLDMDLDITDDPNPEIKQRWYPLGIRFAYEPVFDMAHDFVSSQGRMKYINPVYDALIQSGYRDLAYEWYQENLNFYHPIALTQLEAMLLKQESPVDESRAKYQRMHQQFKASNRIVE